MPTSLPITIGFGPRKAPNIVSAEITVSSLQELYDSIKSMPSSALIFLCAKDGRYPEYYVNKLQELNVPVSGCGGIRLVENMEGQLEREFQELLGKVVNEIPPQKYAFAHTTATQSMHLLEISHGILFRRDTFKPDFPVYLRVAGDDLEGWPDILLSAYWERNKIERMCLCIPVMNRFFMDAMKMVKPSSINAEKANTYITKLREKGISC